MSVPEGQRSKGQLAVETETEKLLQYTITSQKGYSLSKQDGRLLYD